MNKNRAIWSLVLTTLLLALPVAAQTETARLERAQVDIWPDFDAAAVLVLVTGELPPGTELPATVRVRIPTAAGSPSAVARITSDGSMLNTAFDTESDGDATLVTLETTELIFRVEYYYAYDRSGNSVQFGYEWLGGAAADDLTILFQEPSQAAAVAVDSGFEDLGLQSSGQRYYRWQVGAIEADETLAASFSYVAPPANPAAPASSTPEEPSTGRSSVLPIVLTGVGGLLVGVVGGWLLTSRRVTSRPSPARKRRESLPSYCSRCGKKTKPGDGFCRQCGAPLQ